MRVMFVDDEPQVLRGITRMLDGSDVDWELETATSGDAALEQMDSQPVDVLVCDMQMPGMDGAELLQEVSKRYPETVRIVLSGQADKGTVYRAVSPMHQYLAKPCQADTLRDTISRACALREMLDATKSHAFLGRVSSLPSVPDLYQKVVAEIESEQGTLEHIGELITQDAAMTAKILQLANSAIFAVRSKVSSPAQAASMIGMDALKALVLSLQVFKAYEGTTAPGFSIDGLMSHSLRVASFARRIAIAESLDKETVSESFTAGLLHDVGKLVLVANAAEDFTEAISAARSRSIPLIDAEQEVFGLGHDGIGGYLLALWGLPQPIVEAVAFHHRPQESVGSQLTPAVMVYVANAFSNEQSESAESSDWQTCAAYLGNLGLADRLKAWRHAITEEEDE